MVERIVAWNKERNLFKYDRVNEINMLFEELRELIEAKNSNEEVDALCDIVVVAIGAINKLGYDPTKSMDETLKEIESRKGFIDKSGKFSKFVDNASKSQWYKAQYEKESR